MKKLLFFTVLCLSAYTGYSQAYISMPTDSAIWRYRIYDIDYITHVLDNVLFLNGTDTFANGKTYHKIMSRTMIRTVPNGSIPPIVPVTANYADMVYGGMRESGKQVFLLDMHGEQLIYDYNAVAGDSIPAYNCKKMVTSIDSVLINGVYRKRYLTTDAAYYVIEGIGSSEGLIPDLNDGRGSVQFMCFTDTPATFSPDTTIPCTYVYPIGYASAVYNVNRAPEINVFPIPASDMLHITFSGSGTQYAAILNSIGQVIWNGAINEQQDIPVSSWAKGVYYLRVSTGKTGYFVKKILIM